MDSFKVSDLSPNTTFKTDIMLDRLFLLSPAGSPITSETLKALEQWGVKTLEHGDVTTKKAVEEPEAQKAAPAAKKDSGKSKETKTQTVTEKKTEAEPQDAPINPEDAYPPVKEIMSRNIDGQNENTKNEFVQEIYKEYLKYIDVVYTHYATHKAFNVKEISATIMLLVAFIRKYRRHVLRITPTLEERNKKFLVIHSMRTTVLAITIGIQLNMQDNKLIELGVASLLHEIGMLKLPPHLYMNDKPLTVAEKNQILMHPLFSFNILKDANFPLNIQLGVLDHHERENGSGYPRHRENNKISMYGKILAVACSFEAITAPRQFKEPKSTYEAMLEMLKNANHQYDETILRALLLSLSLFPIGAYVYLSNGKTAQVADANPNDPKNPIVQLVGESNPDGSPITLQTDSVNMKIVRVLNKQESLDLLKALEKVNKPKEEASAPAADEVTEEL